MPAAEGAAPSITWLSNPLPMALLINRDCKILSSSKYDPLFLYLPLFLEIILKPLPLLTSGLSNFQAYSLQDMRSDQARTEQCEGCTRASHGPLCHRQRAFAPLLQTMHPDFPRHTLCSIGCATLSHLFQRGQEAAAGEDWEPRAFGWNRGASSS